MAQSMAMNQSPLDRLPQELRDMIYDFVASAPSTILVSPLDPSLANLRDLFTKLEWRQYKCRSLLNLSATCHQLRHECTRALYARRTFCIWMGHFVPLPLSRRYPRIDAFSHVRNYDPFGPIDAFLDSIGPSRHYVKNIKLVSMNLWHHPDRDGSESLLTRVCLLARADTSYRLALRVKFCWLWGITGPRSRTTGLYEFDAHSFKDCCTALLASLRTELASLQQNDLWRPVVKDTIDLVLGFRTSAPRAVEREMEQYRRIAWAGYRPRR